MFAYCILVTVCVENSFIKEEAITLLNSKMEGGQSVTILPKFFTCCCIQIVVGNVSIFKSVSHL
jgi:hypothetical protein